MTSTDGGRLRLCGWGRRGGRSWSWRRSWCWGRGLTLEGFKGGLGFSNARSALVVSSKISKSVAFEEGVISIWVDVTPPFESTLNEFGGGDGAGSEYGFKFVVTRIGWTVGTVGIR